MNEMNQNPPDELKKPRIATFWSDQENQELVNGFLLSCGVHVSSFQDPRLFIQEIQDFDPSVCIIQVATREIKVCQALIGSIKKVLGNTLPLIVILKPEDKTAFDPTLEQHSIKNWFQTPVDLVGLAKILSKYIVTDQLADMLREGSSKLPKAVTYIFETVSAALLQIESVLEPEGVSDQEIETRVQFYAQLMIPHRESFQDMMKTLRKPSSEDEEYSLERCVRLYGVENTRNLIVLDKLLKAVRKQGITFNDKTKLLVDEPTKLLAMTTRLTESFADLGTYRHTIFMAGIVLDLLLILTDQQTALKAALKKELDALLPAAMKTARLAGEKAKTQKELPHAKHIVTCLFCEIAARLILGICHPEAFEFFKGAEKRGASPRILHVVCEQKFGVSPAVLGALLAYCTPFLRSGFESVLFLRHPEIVEGDTHWRPTFTLASVLN